MTCLPSFILSQGDRLESTSLTPRVISCAPSAAGASAGAAASDFSVVAACAGAAASDFVSVEAAGAAAFEVAEELLEEDPQAAREAAVSVAARITARIFLNFFMFSPFLTIAAILLLLNLIRVMKVVLLSPELRQGGQIRELFGAGDDFRVIQAAEPAVVVYKILSHFQGCVADVRRYM